MEFVREEVFGPREPFPAVVEGGGSTDGEVRPERSRMAAVLGTGLGLFPTHGDALVSPAVGRRCLGARSRLKKLQARPCGLSSVTLPQMSILGWVISLKVESWQEENAAFLQRDLMMYIWYSFPAAREERQLIR